MDALLSLETGGTVNQDLPALAPPPLPKPGRANAAAAPATPLAYARPTGPRRDPNWRPPGSEDTGGFGALFVTRILPIGGGVLALLFVLALAVDALKLPVVLILGLAGMLMMLTGGIGCLLCAFRESSICGLLYLFVPLYGLYYILSRLEDTKVYVLTWLGGIACMVAVVMLVPKDNRRNRAELPAAGPPAVVLAQGVVTAA
jgi:hypothetical protein